jgi:hypothetical protein
MIGEVTVARLISPVDNDRGVIGSACGMDRNDGADASGGIDRHRAT